jgi:RimJ/RimL family protein N-acetyltransferase
MLIRTERLALRPFEAGDFEAVHRYGSDPAVVRYTSFGPNTPEETRAFLDRTAEDAAKEPRMAFDFAITVPPSNEPIGGCGIYLREARRQIGELGYCLRRQSWGQGIAPEAVNAMLDLGFGDLGLHRIFARCHPDNRNSARVMEKCGMRYEGHLRESHFIKGEWWDFLQYSVLARERLGRS